MAPLRYLVGLALALSGLFQPLAAHPGEHHDDIKDQIIARNNLASRSALALEECSNSPEGLARAKRAAERREEYAHQLRRKRSLEASTYFPKVRDLADLQGYEESSHLSKLKGVSEWTPPWLLFGKNTSCILTPEVTYGPYWISGEYIRKDVTERQKGIPLTVELEFIDIKTCKPLPNLMIEIWNANSTGVYGGIVQDGNGIGASDIKNINTTFLRGLQPTNKDGVAVFDTIFPGHYSGRATHLHVIAHERGKVLRNHTYSGGQITHVGQIFFDEDLRAKVETTAPYSTNNITTVTNDADMWAPQQASTGYDPLLEYVVLGHTLKAGLFGWISIGINVTANYTIDFPAGSWTEDGGVPAPSPTDVGPPKPPS